jgi:hypothetical protein
VLFAGSMRMNLDPFEHHSDRHAQNTFSSIKRTVYNNKSILFCPPADGFKNYLLKENKKGIKKSMNGNWITRVQTVIKKLKTAELL